MLATAAGTLVKKNQFLELEIPGLKHSFVLEGGAQAGALKKRADLVGKKVEVAGKLHPNHAGQPPGLTVESFRAAP
ncbi:MAG: hypothetical protein HY646_11150 [Acidobacteria bacterium]|nr:hypothetical protein [Acidobacteriota bacterium]